MDNLTFLRPMLLLRVRSLQVSCSRLVSSLPTFNKNAAFTFTQPPNPNWKYGDGLPANEKAWREQGDEPRLTWDLTTMPPKFVPSRHSCLDICSDGIVTREVYPLLTSAIIPRPIAFVSSLSPDGKHNLAPFRYVTCDSIH